MYLPSRKLLTYISCTIISALIIHQFASYFQWSTRHGPGSRSGTKSEMATLGSIRLQSAEDDQSTMRLLDEYLLHPERAKSVKELIVNPSHGGYGAVGESQQLEPHQYDDDVTFQKAIKALNLSEKGEDYVRSGIVWKKLDLQSQQSTEGKVMNDLDLSRTRAYESRAGNLRFVDAMTTILIALCPNLEVLKVNRLGQPARELLLQTNYNERSDVLQKLRHFEVITGSGSYGFDDRYFTRHDILNTLRFVHRLPRLELVRFTGVHSDERDLWPPGTSTIRKIQIDKSDIPSAVLSTIIRMPKALEELIVSVGGHSTHDGSEGGIIYPLTIGKSLFYQSESLRVLDLDIDAYIHCPSGQTEDHTDLSHELLIDHIEWQRDKYWKIDEAATSEHLIAKDLLASQDNGQTIGSFKNFTALTHLSIGIIALLGGVGHAPFRLVDALPPSLEYLCIRGHKAGQNQEHTSQIAELMQIKSEKLPNLKEVRGVAEYVPSSSIAEYSEEDDQ